jgi:hypothetical protein
MRYKNSIQKGCLSPIALATKALVVDAGFRAAAGEVDGVDDYYYRKMPNGNISGKLFYRIFCEKSKIELHRNVLLRIETPTDSGSFQKDSDLTRVCFLNFKHET